MLSLVAKNAAQKEETLKGGDVMGRKLLSKSLRNAMISEDQKENQKSANLQSYPRASLARRLLPVVRE